MSNNSTPDTALDYQLERLVNSVDTVELANALLMLIPAVEEIIDDSYDNGLTEA